MVEFRLSARRVEWLCGLPHFGGVWFDIGLRAYMPLNLHGMADSNRKKTRCKQAGNA